GQILGVAAVAAPEGFFVRAPDVVADPGVRRTRGGHPSCDLGRIGRPAEPGHDGLDRDAPLRAQVGALDPREHTGGHPEWAPHDLAIGAFTELRTVLETVVAAGVARASEGCRDLPGVCRAVRLARPGRNVALEGQVHALPGDRAGSEAAGQKQHPRGTGDSRRHSHCSPAETALLGLGYATCAAAVHPLPERVTMLLLTASDPRVKNLREVSGPLELARALRGTPGRDTGVFSRWSSDLRRRSPTLADSLYGVSAPPEPGSRPAGIGPAAK